jgi:transcriptional regulator with XRE-family HTH domain
MCQASRWGGYRGRWLHGRIWMEIEGQDIDIKEQIGHNVSYMKKPVGVTQSHAFWRLKRLRELKGITLEELAARTGLTKSYLSKVERGVSVPSISTALRVAEAFETGVGDLFGVTASNNDFVVVRRDERKPFSRKGANTGYRYEAIAPGQTHGLFEAFVVHPPFEEPPDYKRSQHPGHEMLFVVKGRIDVTFPHTSVKLAAGDCMVFGGQLPHRVLSVRPQRAEALVVVTGDTATPHQRETKN